MGALPFNNQVFPTATTDGTGTSGDSPIPSGSNNTINRMSDGSVNGSANQSPDSDVPRISSIFNRLANVKNTQENERFKLNEPVEETKDLIAAHNVDAGKLIKHLCWLYGKKFTEFAK